MGPDCACVVHLSIACLCRVMLTSEESLHLCRTGTDRGDPCSLPRAANDATKPLAALVADAAGPLPDYHPVCLRAALLLGRPGVATAAVRALLRALSDNAESVNSCPENAEQEMPLSLEVISRVLLHVRD